MPRNSATLPVTGFWFDTARRRRDFAGLILLLSLAIAFPIRTNTTRVGCLVLAAAAWCMGLLVFRSSKSVRAVLVGVALLVIAVAAIPGRPVDPHRLRGEYVHALRAYTGVKYVWGGENALGIDCSGLVREGMIDATLREGVATLNPSAIRESFFLWRHDCSAEQLGLGYGGRTVPLLETPSLTEVDYGKLQPGDIAVTEGGAHTLAYLGDRTWIEADPGDYAGKVIQVNASHTRNPWFSVPMQILRWRQLA